MIELGLQRISQLLAQTALPWRAIHVAGTNGKGSVCAYISEMLNIYNRSELRSFRHDAPLRHGRFTSPHLVDRWDCISLSSGKHMECLETVGSGLFHDIEQDVLARNAKHGIDASQFEILTATAFEIFTRSKLDVAVVETGMGGRLDATNILGQPDGLDLRAMAGEEFKALRPPPLVTAITKIGMDHQGFLGNTIGAIAREKAGIFKPHVPTVWDLSNEQDVCRTLEKEAHARLSPQLNNDTQDGSEYICQDPTMQSHIVNNHRVALRATLHALRSLGRVPCTEHQSSCEQSNLFTTLIEEWKTVSARLHFSGRLEWVDVSPLVGAHKRVLLDGAHNAQSALVLGDAANKLRGTLRPICWILAASDSKELDQILGPLIQNGDSVFAVEFGPVDGMPWVKPMSASNILAAARDLAPELSITRNCQSDIVGAVKLAVNACGQVSKESKVNIVVAGSLYLVGDVHRLLRGVRETSGSATSDGLR